MSETFVPSPIFKVPPLIISSALFKSKPDSVTVVVPELCVKIPFLLFIPTSAKLPPVTFTLPFQLSELSRVNVPVSVTLIVEPLLILTFAPCSTLP